MFVVTHYTPDALPSKTSRYNSPLVSLFRCLLVSLPYANPDIKIPVGGIPSLLQKVRLLPQTDLFRGLPAFMQAGRLSFGVP